MTFSSNEQELAKRTIRKLIYRSSDVSSDISYVYDINDYGYIESSSLNNVFVGRRSETYYQGIYKQDVLDDTLDEFEKSFKFIKHEYINDAELELYKKGNFSLVLDVANNRIRLAYNKYYKSLSAKCMMRNQRKL